MLGVKAPEVIVTATTASSNDSLPDRIESSRVRRATASTTGLDHERMAHLARGLATP
jgi:hypothetical protein